MAGIGLLVAWQEKARFIVAAVVFVVTKQYNGGCHGLRCRLGWMHGGGGGGVVCRVLDYESSSCSQRTCQAMSLFPTAMA